MGKGILKSNTDSLKLVQKLTGKSMGNRVGEKYKNVVGGSRKLA